eukprot:3937438-Rhodomonas_salina.2
MPYIWHSAECAYAGTTGRGGRGEAPILLRRGQYVASPLCCYAFATPYPALTRRMLLPGGQYGCFLLWCYRPTRALCDVRY